jgi:hypothetical protein
MDGKHRDTSMRLVLASVPLQALMMVGAAALVFGGASASPVQNVQISVQPGPAGGPVSRIAVVPLEGCQASGYEPALPAAGGPYPSTLTPVAGCVDSYFFAGTDKSPDVVYLPVPCCGG